MFIVSVYKYDTNTTKYLEFKSFKAAITAMEINKGKGMEVMLFTEIPLTDKELERITCK